jgi:hypothetical protein
MRNLVGAVMVVLLGGMQAAEATPVIGGSGFLTDAYASQLEGWLGEGPIQLTNIFTKKAGDRAQAFHAAADGQGRTFTVIEVFYGAGNSQHSVIGGYNPQSWSSSDQWHSHVPLQ